MKTTLRLLKIVLATTVIMPLLVWLNLDNALASGNGKHKPAAAPAKTGSAKAAALTAPTVSYNTPNSYYAGSSVNITPTSTGVAAQGYNATPVTLYTGSEPYGVAGDALGNVYMAATFNSSVLKIPAGGGSPVAIGSGFSFPIDVAADLSGNVYVADNGNGAIKMIAPGGAVSTLATGLNGPTGVAVDPSGNVLFVDNESILKEIPAGTGTVKVLASSLTSAYMVAVDGKGNAYVTRISSGDVIKVTYGGTLSTFATGINSPDGIAVDGAGNVYVCSSGDNKVYEIPAGGGTPTAVGSGFNDPIGLAIDGLGNIIVGDGGHSAVKSVAPTGGFYISPQLPQGLTFNQTTGVIGGTAAVNSPNTAYTVTAYNASGSAAASLNIQTSILSVAYSTPQNFTAGTPVGPVSPTSANVSSIQYNTAALATPTSFTSPKQLAADASGNIFIAAAGNNTIEKLTPAGVITTVGSGFSSPAGVAVDALNNVFVADYGNNAIKKIPGGSGTPVTVVSGVTNPTAVAVNRNGDIYYLLNNQPYVYELQAGSTTPLLVSRNFNKPVALACDASGNIYIADGNAGYLYRIAFGGGFPNYVATVSGITGVSTDYSGNVYVGDHSSNSIHVFSSGSTTPVLVSGAFNNPTGIAVDPWGNVFAADATAGSVQKIMPAGGYFINTFLPSGLNFNSATGAISGTPTGAASTTNYTVNAYNSYGSGSASFVATSTLPSAPTVSYNTPVSLNINSPGAITPGGSGVSAPAYSNTPVKLGSGYNQPEAVCTDALGNVYVADYANSQVYKVAAGSSTPVSLGAVGTPDGVAVDAAGNVFVSSWINGTIVKIPAGGGSSSTFASGLTPAHLCFDAAGNLYEADFNTGIVYKFPAGGGAKTAFATGLSFPEGIAADGLGNIYVTESGNANDIKEYPAGGGSPITIKPSGLGALYGLAIDPAGNLFIADRNVNAIWELTPGSSTVFPVGSGFNSVYDVAVDNSGDLFVADQGTSSVKEIKPAGGYYLNKFLPAGLTFSTATGAITGTPTALSSQVTYSVTGYNPGGKTAASVSFQVVSTDATLSALNLITGTLSPAFSPSVASYTSTVPATTTSISVQPTASFQYASIMVNGNAVPSGTVSDAIPLNYGSNIIDILVTAEDGVSTQGYTITVTRAKSGNANLSSIGPSNGSLSPAFGANTLSYNLSVSNAIASITVAPVTADANATMTVNGTALASGTTSAPIALAEGATTNISIVVKAQNGVTTKTYTIAVARAVSTNATLSGIGPSNGPLSPVFAPNTINYTLNVPNSVATMTLTPVATDAHATITVNGVAVASGATSNPLPLAEGATTNLTVVVKAQDGTTTKTYTIVVTRAPSADASLSNLTPGSGALNPAFSSTKLAYTMSVPNATTTMKVTPVVTDSHSTITVNGNAVASGTASAAIPLAEGIATYITIVVKAQDGTTTKTYSVAVTRAASSNATLSSMGPSNGPLSPVFAPSKTSYTLSVPNTVATMTVTPVAADTHATITVNGTAVASGSTSSPIALAEGTTTNIAVVVKAQDGTTTLTYTIVVTRAPSSVATLSAIGPQYGPLSPLFASATTSYTISVANNKPTMTVTPVSTDANATIKVNGTTVASGATSAAINLAEGAVTKINLVVTAQDGTTTKTYTVSVTRAPSSVATLASIGPQYAPLSPVFSSGTTNYTISLDNSKATMTVKPVATDFNATIKVNGTAVASGSTSAPVALTAGGTTDINIVVTAQDGTTTKTYVIAVTRAAGGADSFDNGISVSQPAQTVLLAEDGIKVHQGVSPNGDGIDDVLQIDNIAQYPDNKLTIMNRNGQLVYEARGYDNASKVFDGRSNKNGQMQLPGTYFYQLDYTVNGTLKHKTGFLVLKY